MEPGLSGLLRPVAVVQSGEDFCLRPPAVGCHGRGGPLRCGPLLKAECASLHGCETGEAKITCGYGLPAKCVDVTSSSLHVVLLVFLQPPNNKVLRWEARRRADLKEARRRADLKSGSDDTRQHTSVCLAVARKCVHRSVFSVYQNS
ncbi:O-acetyl-ADP-ribose deacetylase MACROD2 [Liparis tanakae]|uniref:O-acetyl-ADP-ribose deacetylase MACROD2 n=1 Tax=Liparis tanakae TaxID=230148 RepID=A0A4Z2ETS5_9TELE|nr:O-acetyl-ADP-ribose deacetylase MACROD2 [Liparis tanakae]